MFSITSKFMVGRVSFEPKGSVGYHTGSFSGKYITEDVSTK